MQSILRLRLAYFMLSSMTVEHGLPLAALQNTVTSENFADHLLNISWQAHRTHTEVGFAIYQNDGVPGEPAIIRAADVPNMRLDDLGMPISELNMHPLIDKPDGTLRDDLGLLGHTHTFNPLPSGTDTRGFALLNKERPGVIDSVVCMQRYVGVLSLFLMRGRASAHFQIDQSILQHIGSESADIVQAMRRAGILHHTLHYDDSTGKLRSNPRELSRLYG
jgi:hypothetical protein